MASRTWKCVPCGKAFQSSQPRTVGPKCPACGNRLTAASSAPSSSSGTLRLPTPQPRAVPRHESTPIPARRRPASRTLPVARPPAGLRPTGPAEALAIMCGSSDDWIPDPEPEPSPAPPVAFASGPFQPRVPDAEAVADRPTLAASPWTWASIGGVVVALTFSAVFFLNRPRPAQAVGRAASPKSASITQASTATPAAAVTATNTVSPGPVTTDLLPLVDLKRDVIAGGWRIANGALMSDGSARARVGFRLSLPREYDFRVQFTQVDGNNCVSQIFTSQNSGSLVLGGWKRKFTGFQQIRGRWADNPQNPTRLAGLKFENGRMHTSVVKVRKRSIEAWLDGKRIASYATDGSDLSNMDWGVQGYPLGIGSELSSTIFHKVELIEGADDLASQ